MNRKIFLRMSLGMALAIMTCQIDANCGATCTSGCGARGTSRCGGCVTCPRCNACCELKVEKGKESKSCWKVECKDVCIPRIVLPWQSRCNPCANNGARVRTVRVMSKHSYECPACEYSWSVKEGCGGGCTGGCGESCTAPADADVIEEDASTVSSRPSKPSLLPFKTARSRQQSESARKRFADLTQGSASRAITTKGPAPPSAPAPRTVNSASYSYDAYRDRGIYPSTPANASKTVDLPKSRIGSLFK